MNFGFVTCVQLGLSCIKSIYESNRKLSLIITLSEGKGIKKSGRIYLDDFSSENNIPLIKCDSINDPKIIQVIKHHEIEWLFIIGWSQIATKEILESPSKGVIGAHPSLLPIGRGRAAIPWAILKELDKTGVSFFKMDTGVDSGPIISQKIIDVNKNETATSLYSKVDLTHKLIMKELLPLLENGQLNFIYQNNKNATFWPERKPEDGQLDISDSVWKAERLVRATTTPYPGAYLSLDFYKFIIWKADVSLTEPNNQCYLIFNDGFLILTDYEIVEI